MIVLHPYKDVIIVLFIWAYVKVEVDKQAGKLNEAVKVDKPGST